MGLYNVGIMAPEPAIALPEPALQAWQRFDNAHWGFGQIRKGEKRFYSQGLDRVNTSVGAATGGPVGSLVDAAVTLILDVAHVLLILAGMYALWRAITPGLPL